MIVDKDIPPQQTVYYLAALVMRRIRAHATSRFDLAAILKSDFDNVEQLSVDSAMLALDFLYLLGLVKFVDGELECT